MASGALGYAIAVPHQAAVVLAFVRVAVRAYCMDKRQVNNLTLIMKSPCVVTIRRLLVFPSEQLK